jgi:hypothetical protein
MLLLVPVSASPLLPLGSGTLVRPLAFVPALALLVFAGARIFVFGQKPAFRLQGSGLLALFALYVVIAGLCIISGIADEVFKGQTPLGSLIRALATLAIGAVFFLAAQLNIRGLGDARDAMRWLFIGLAASIGFAMVQVLAIVQGGDMLRLVQAITDLFAIRYQGLVNRAQGFTYEPSWLATQIILLMLPPLAARIISRQSFCAEPVKAGSLARALPSLGLALAGLLCAGSRFGLAAGLLVLLIGAAAALRRGRLMAAVVFASVMLAAGGGVAALSGLRAGAGANYVLGPLSLVTDGNDALLADRDVTSSLTEAFSLAGRAAAAQAAFNLWRDHPFFGVSFGNDYRYFGRNAPDWAYDPGLFTLGTSEGAGWVDPNAPEKGNAKNLFLRLLSETGILGFGIFALFCWRQIFAVPARDGYFAYFRLTAAAGLLFSGFNQDSFADPAPWIVLVLCAVLGRAQAGPAQAEAVPA